MLGIPLVLPACIRTTVRKASTNRSDANAASTAAGHPRVDRSRAPIVRRCRWRRWERRRRFPARRGAADRRARPPEDHRVATEREGGMGVEEVRVDLEEDLVEVLVAARSPADCGDPQVLDEIGLPAPSNAAIRSLTGPGRDCSSAEAQAKKQPPGKIRRREVIEEGVGEGEHGRDAGRGRRASARRRPRRRSPPRHRSSRAGAPPSTGSGRTARSCSCRCGRRAPRSRGGRGPRPWPAGRPPRGSRWRLRSPSERVRRAFWIRGSRSASSSVHLFEDVASIRR